MSDDVVNGSKSLPPLSTWKLCDLNSINKLEGYALIYDNQLYTATNGNLGYDICSAQFEQGIFIFEDTFEYWKGQTFQSNQMKSSQWYNIYNGFANDYCGLPSKYGGKNTLVFDGPNYRYAETIDFDVTSGGHVEALLFIAPVGYDVTHPYCKSSYSSYIELQYSIDKGNSWVDFNLYNFNSKMPVMAGH
eukprot:gene19227-25078_t